MSRRELIHRLIAGEEVPRCGFWLGNPHEDTWPLLHRHFGTTSEEQLRKRLGDDLRWICPQFYDDVYQDPTGAKLFDASLDREEHGSCGPLAHCEDPAEVDVFPWPNPDYLNFDSCLKDLRGAGDVYRLSGFWTCFYHNVADLFGMEEYFIMPWFRKFAEQGHRHGYQVVLHSCGSIKDVIERLIEAGVDCLHPLQAKAANMDAETLARDFKGRITFLGGIDTQHLLTHGTMDEVRDEVRRVKRLLGCNLIVSPSHEALLPNVPPANVEALAEATREPSTEVTCPGELV